MSPFEFEPQTRHHFVSNIGRFERYVALRYLRGIRGSTRSYRFLRFVVYIAIGGVAVGATALLLALAITRGFKTQIESKIVEFAGHVQVENIDDAPISDSSVHAALLEMDGVESVLPVVQELVLLRSRHEIDGVGIWGTTADNMVLARSLTQGVGDLSTDNEGRPAMILSERLASTLGVQLGSVTTAFSTRGNGGAGLGSLAARPKIKQFHVAGIYDTGLVEFDDLHAFVDLQTARALLDYDESDVTRYDVLLSDIANADQTAYDIEKVLGFPYMARSIFQVHRNLFDWVKLQQSIIPLVVGAIILVAALNIVGILLMMILEKNREIGIMRSMGASAEQVRRLFLYLGLMIGVVGVAIGSILAGAASIIQNRFGLIPVP